MRTTPINPEDAVAAVARRLSARHVLPDPPTRKDLREAAGLSVAELANDMGVTRQAVAQWERGDRRPRGNNLEVYAAVLEALRP